MRVVDRQRTNRPVAFDLYKEYLGANPRHNYKRIVKEVLDVVRYSIR